MHKKEYEWVKQNRKTLFAFCKELDGEDFTRENGVGFESIRNTLLHVSSCYIAWLGSFILLETRKPIIPPEEMKNFNLEDIIKRYELVDEYVNKVFEAFGQKLDEPIEQPIPWREQGDVISMSPNKLLMHTITHEYHHKGQITAMARNMGYVPPNTDVLGTDD